jgi:hypothetical protein
MNENDARCDVLDTGWGHVDDSDTDSAEETRIAKPVKTTAPLATHSPKEATPTPTTTPMEEKPITFDKTPKGFILESH